jgi:aspartate/methionine/tyrosine aminotransferase
MTSIPAFRLEEYLATREFNAKFMFCGSDVESRSIADLLSFISESERESFLNLSLKYTTPSGNIALRESLAEMIPGLHSRNFLCFAGAEEAIYATAQSLLNSSDHVVTITPCYQSLKTVAATICSVTEVPLDKKDGSWHLDIEKIEDSIRPNTRIVFVNFPHNPTGFIPSQDVFQKLVDLVRKHGIYLFSDEVYYGLSLNPKDTLPYASQLYEKALSLGVCSKSFGLPGLRIGWISCQDEMTLDKLVNFKHYLSICNSAPSEYLAKIAIDHRDEIWAENNQLLTSNFKILKEYFNSNKELFEWMQPQGGCICYPRYRGREPILKLADDLLDRMGVVILPDWVYEQENNHFRLSFGRKNMTQALDQFSNFFRERPS